MVIPHFIVLSGVCASGKTTIGKELAKHLNAKFIDGDDYHAPESIKKMSDGIGLNDDDRREWLIKLSHFGDQSHQIVLACSALKRAYRLVLAGTKSPNEYRIFMLMTDRSVLEERLRNRKNHYAKISLLDSQFQALETPSDDETNVIKIDVSGSVDETLQKIINRLRD